MWKTEKKHRLQNKEKKIIHTYNDILYTIADTPSWRIHAKSIEIITKQISIAKIVHLDAMRDEKFL
nr:MAG TPA: hypothetical protein [Caudoviricetes sp.]